MEKYFKIQVSKSASLVVSHQLTDKIEIAIKSSSVLAISILDNITINISDVSDGKNSVHDIKVDVVENSDALSLSFSDKSVFSLSKEANTEISIAINELVEQKITMTTSALTKDKYEGSSYKEDELIQICDLPAVKYFEYLSGKVYTLLRRFPIDCQPDEIRVGDILTTTETDLLRIRSIGKGTVQKIKSFLAGKDLSLGMNIPNWKSLREKEK